MGIQTFRALHQTSSPLLLPTAWNAASAVLAEQSGALAVATSSAALVWSLGYADGGHLPTDVLCDAIARITAKAKTPVSVDIEDGYSSDVETVAALVRQLQTLGVVGINIEDGEQAPSVLAEKIIAIKQACGEQIFINARTDVFLRGLASGEAAIQETARRAAIYAEAGADGLFVPGVGDAATVTSIVANTSLPVNAMSAANPENVQALTQAGVSRISFGPHLFLQAHQVYMQQISGVIQCKSRQALDYDKMNQWMTAELCR